MYQLIKKILFLTTANNFYFLILNIYLKPYKIDVDIFVLVVNNNNKTN